VLLEAANFDPLTVLRSGERHRMRTESQTRWEKGCRSGARRACGHLRVAAARRACGRPLDGRERSARRDPAAAGGSRFAPAMRIRCSGWRCRRTSSATGLAGSASASTRIGPCARLPGVGAMSRRDNRRRRRSRARFRLRRRARDSCRCARRCSACSSTSSVCAARSRTCSSARGCTEAYTYSLQAIDPDPNAIELPVPLSSQQRLLRTTLAVGLLGAADATTSTAGTRTSSSSRLRTSICRQALCRRSAGASAGSSKGTSSRRRESSRQCSLSCTSSRPSSA